MQVLQYVQDRTEETESWHHASCNEPSRQLGDREHRRRLSLGVHDGAAAAVVQEPRVRAWPARGEGGSSTEVRLAIGRGEENEKSQKSSCDQRLDVRKEDMAQLSREAAIFIVIFVFFSFLVFRVPFVVVVVVWP